MVDPISTIYVTTWLLNYLANKCWEVKFSKYFTGVHGIKKTSRRYLPFLQPYVKDLSMSFPKKDYLKGPVKLVDDV